MAEMLQMETDMMGPDDLLSCFIYVLVKAHAHDTPALLTLVNYYTLEEHQGEFEFVNTTLSASIQFIRTELVKLCEPTLHYTYIDGKSCIDDNTPQFTPDSNTGKSNYQTPNPLSRSLDGDENNNSYLLPFLNRHYST